MISVLFTDHYHTLLAIAVILVVSLSLLKVISYLKKQDAQKLKNQAKSSVAPPKHFNNREVSHYDQRFFATIRNEWIKKQQSLLLNELERILWRGLPKKGIERAIEQKMKLIEIEQLVSQESVKMAEQHDSLNILLKEWISIEKEWCLLGPTRNWSEDKKRCKRGESYAQYNMEIVRGGLSGILKGLLEIEIIKKEQKNFFLEWNSLEGSWKKLQHTLDDLKNKENLDEEKPMTKDAQNLQECIMEFRAYEKEAEKILQSNLESLELKYLKLSDKISEISMIIEQMQDDLDKEDLERKKIGSRQVYPADEPPALKERKIEIEIDLHGFKAADGLSSFVRSYNSNIKRYGSNFNLTVIHGYHSDAIRDKLRNFLINFKDQLSFVEGEEYDGNPGITIIFPKESKEIIISNTSDDLQIKQPFNASKNQTASKSNSESSVWPEEAAIKLLKLKQTLKF
ncbi:MAG: recombination and DNA strand exchange inhibitor protein [Deltaproteobacteria bacterium ADurb.Bin135]|nr:MAG: recombination and DNA strand exchange inhibitor protein [Deltaproteobacteria bacterium ADurb.Bin135]